jgi:hypothetical protein
MIDKGAKAANAPQNDDFLAKSSCRLSYQACPIPRIVGRSGMAGLRGPAVRYYFFDPAETT